MSNHADALRYLTTYGWHNPNYGEYGCDRYTDRVPDTDRQWTEVPDTCECGFYDAIHHLMKADHESREKR